MGQYNHRLCAIALKHPEEEAGERHHMVVVVISWFASNFVTKRTRHSSNFTQNKQLQLNQFHYILPRHQKETFGADSLIKKKKITTIHKRIGK